MSTATAISERFFLSSVIGKKYLMAVTGLMWMGFLMAHMIGNFLLFVGPDAYNAYSHKLITNPAIYLAEGLLVLTIFSHIVTAISLTIQNRTARGEQYAAISKGEKATPVNSKTMAIHGAVILIFLINHLLTFKFGTVYWTSVNNVEMRDIYRLVIEVFQNPVYIIWYVVALLLLGTHLSHGAKSVFQSLGFLNDKYSRKINLFAVAYSLIVVIGFLVQPIFAFSVGRSL